MKGKNQKSYLRPPEAIDALLPFLSLLLLILPILIGRLSFGDLRIAEASIPPRGTRSEPTDVITTRDLSSSVLFHLSLGLDTHETALVEEATGKRLYQLKLNADTAAPSVIATEFRRLQRKHPGLETVLTRTEADVPYGTLISILTALQSPPTNSVHRYAPAAIVVIPREGP